MRSRNRPSLEQIRETILKHRIVTFEYNGGPVRCEPHALANARRTNSFVVVGWSLGIIEGWQLYRFSMISDWKVEFETFGARPPVGKLIRSLSLLETRAGCFQS